MEALNKMAIDFTYLYPVTSWENWMNMGDIDYIRKAKGISLHNYLDGEYEI